MKTESDERPVCNCHGEPMNRGGLRRDAVVWRCAIKNAENKRRFYEESTEKERERKRRYREENPVTAAELRRRSYERNRGTALDYARRYRENNPDKIREANARRLWVSGMYLGTFGFTKKEREAILSGSAN